MRLLGGFFMFFGAVGLWGTISNFGNSGDNWLQLIKSSLIAIVFIALGLYMYRRPARKRLANEKKLNELPEVKNSDFKHVFDTSAIALNKSSQTLFIADINRRKSYSFSEVRGWNYAVLAGGATLGGKMENGPVGQLQAFVTAREFFRVTHQNKVGSGLFVEVRDIDHPKWRINFKRDKVMEKELLRWMEILRQNINENQ